MNFTTRIPTRILQPFIILFTVGLLVVMLIPFATHSTQAKKRTVTQPVITELKGVQEGQAVIGTVTIEALVSGENITQVAFQLDGPQSASHIEKRAPYSFSGDENGHPRGWDTTRSPDGQYTLTVTASNKAGKSGSLAVHFSIGNHAQPQVTSTIAPEPSATAEPSPAPNQQPVPTATSEPTPAATAVPEPTAAAPTPSAPVISGFNGAQDGQPLSGQVAIEALVSGDNITQVVFQIDGPKPMSHVEKLPPYYILGDNNGVPSQWDTTQYPNGDYTLTATATNTAGQSGSLKIYFPIVNNLQSQPTTQPTAQPTPQPTATVQPQPTTAPPPTSIPPMPAQQMRWPHLYGKTGPYSAHNIDSEVYDFVGDGHNMYVGNYQAPGSPFATLFSNKGNTYIEDMIWYILFFKHCNAQRPCDPDTNPSLQSSILADVQAHLAQVQNDPNVAGFWVLDDNNGQMVQTLEKIHTLVVQSNASAPFPRATVCGFGGYLDQRSSLTSPFVPNHEYFDPAIQNYSPNACDITVFYPYGFNKGDDPNPELVDWSMSNLLPYMIEKAKSVGKARVPGWDPNTFVWGGMNHVWGQPDPWKPYNFVLPTASEIVTQAKAYCQGGALFLTFYAWDDTVNKTPANTPELRQGIKDGAAWCQNYWAGTTSSP